MYVLHTKVECAAAELLVEMVKLYGVGCINAVLALRVYSESACKH